MRNPQLTVRRVLLLSFGVTLLANTSLPACAISISGSKKNASFDLPCAEKLDADTAGDADQSQANNPELAPMSLGDSKPKDAPATTTGATTAATEKEGTLNASVTTNSFVPKGPLEGDSNSLLAPTSVKGSKVSKVSGLVNGSISETAKAINVAPLALIESSESAEQKLDDKTEIEREQITALWEATLTRSPDINFVLQKLMPNSDPSKVTTLLMRLLSTAAMGGVAATSMVMPGSGGYMIQSGGYSIIQNLLSASDSKAAKNAKVTQTEQIQLYNMIRTTADKLVEKYRAYKGKHESLYQANVDFEELKSIAPEAKKDGAKVIEIEYTLKKQQRDIKLIGSELSKCRQDLLDLAGGDAVAKLDVSIDDEYKRLNPELAAAAAQVEAQRNQQSVTLADDVKPPQAAPDDSKVEQPGTQVADRPGNAKDEKNHFKLPL